MKEQWKDVVEYEGLYEISNLGRVKSLARNGLIKRNKISKKKERILKAGLNIRGYFCVLFCKKGIIKNKSIHTIVWDHFGVGKRNGRIIQVDHIDNNKLNNRIDNLQLLNTRKNCTKGWLAHNTSSKYTGVGWSKTNNKWIAQIKVDGKNKYLGHFEDENDASIAYEKALSII